MTKPKRLRGLCKVDGCEKPDTAAEYCQSHYHRLNRYGSPTGLPTKERPSGCRVKGCSRSHKAKGLCSGHYERLRKHGSPRESEPLVASPYSARRKSIDEPGTPRARGKYVSYYWPEHPIAIGRGNKRDVQEHHLLYWQQSGYDPGVLKELCKKETEVHHIDGDYEGIDANLEIATVGKHAGTSESDKVKHLISLGYRVHPPLWKIKRG